jgi:hypothetical protein
MPWDNDDNNLTDPPNYDMLTIRFRGDNHDVVLPYCEVANGDITEIEDNLIKVAVNDKKKNVLKLPFADFVKLIEETFDIKDIVKLMVQKAGSYDNVTVL